MTLETAKRIVQEQGELANKEALAIVRGGMTICENLANGRRKYVWIKVKPTMTDEETSIELAIETYRKRKQPKRSKVVLPPKEEKATPEIDEPKQTSELEPTPVIHRLVSTLKGKFSHFVKLMDEIVDE